MLKQPSDGTRTDEVRVNILVPPQVRTEWKLFATATGTSVKDLIIQGMDRMMKEKGWDELRARIGRKTRR